MKEFTVSEFADLCGVARKTMYNYINIGIIKPQHKLNGRPFFTEIDLEFMKNIEELPNTDKKSEVYRNKNKKFDRKLKIEKVGEQK